IFDQMAQDDDQQRWRWSTANGHVQRFFRLVSEVIGRYDRDFVLPRRNRYRACELRPVPTRNLPYFALDDHAPYTGRGIDLAMNRNVRRNDVDPDFITLFREGDDEIYLLIAGCRVYCRKRNDHQYGNNQYGNNQYGNNQSYAHSRSNPKN